MNYENHYGMRKQYNESMSGKITQHHISNGRREKSVRPTETNVYSKFAEGITFRS